MPSSPHNIRIGNLAWSKLLPGLRILLFSVFYLLCLRQFVLFYSLIPAENHFIFFLFCFLFLLICLLWNIWILHGIFLSVPLFTGLEILKIISLPFPVYSLLFSAYFLFWLPYRLLSKEGGLAPTTEVDNLTDLLAGMVIVSLASILGPFWKDGITDYFWISFPDDWKFFNNFLFSLNYGFILLQGLFFFRVSAKELSRRGNLHLFYPAIVAQAGIVLIFALIQLIFQRPPKYQDLGLLSPFYDIHSFGACIALVFFIFLSFFLKKPMFIFLIPGLALFFLAVLSYSRTTWAALILSGVVFFFFSNFSRKYLRIAGALFVLLILSLISLPILNINNGFFNRLYQLVTFQDLGVRLTLWMRAVNIILDFPITGSGIGTFYRYSVLYQDWDTPVFRNVQEHAHNYFLQFAADLGLPALIVLLSIFFYSFKIGLAVMARDSKNAPLVKGILFGILAYLITCVTGYPLFQYNQIFLFWFLMAALAVSYRLWPVQIDFSGAYYKTRLWKIGLAILLVVGYFPWIWGMNQRKPLAELGFHSWECAEGKCHRWTSRKTVTNVFSQGNILEYEMTADPQFTAQKPQRFSLIVNDQLVDQRNFFYAGKQKYSFYLPPPEERLLQIRTEVQPTFNPNRVGLSADTRDLGVVLTPFSFSEKLSEEGLGFYPRERWTGPLPEGWPAGRPLVLRWTALRASFPRPSRDPADLEFFVFAGNPDILQKPLHLKIFGDRELVHREAFQTPGWHAIRIPADRLKEMAVITLQTDRVWNPKMAGLSQDVRDLGVAVACPY
jgi:O-antigen ligase